MVRIVFCTRPAYGHVYPLMPLAMAARAAGHEVSVATTGSFLPTMAKLGFATHDVGVSIEQARQRLVASLPSGEMPRHGDGRPDIEMGGRLFLGLVAPRTAGDLARVLRRHRVDLVVYEQYDLGAGVAAHAAGIPAVCHALSPRMPDEAMVAMAGHHLERLWSGHGVSPASFDVFTGDAYLDIVPDVLQQRSFLAHDARLRIRPVPFAEPGALVPSGLAGDRPLVYLTLGTVVGADDVLRPVIEGLGALDVDVLVALGSADGTALGRMPANVRVETFVDQPAVLRHADLAIHHGGSGTLLGALISGTRQLLLPKGADQFWNADLVTRARLGAVLEPGDVTPEAVAAMAMAELARHRPAVDAARADLAAMPEPSSVVAQLERMVADRSDGVAA